MKQYIILSLVLITSQNILAQCTKGNCINGNGTYNYGWCVYTGEFKNAKPEGKGTMKYDDYSYTGNFKNGVEDGDGEIVNKDGTKENVHYTAGKKEVSQLEKIPENEYKPLQNKDCLAGNCVTGYGTLQFSSGNKYIGNFKNSKMEGQGVFYFTNGDKFDGICHNNERSSGTYYYSIGATYKGTYDDKGYEYNGAVTSSTGMVIPYVNGKAIIPPAPKVTYTNSNGTGQSGSKETPIKACCPICNCSGKYGQSYTYTKDGYRYSERPSCINCGGTGRVN